MIYFPAFHVGQVFAQDRLGDVLRSILILDR